ncbi:hypothetical protein D7X25_19490 [bacterium 1XD42-8]|jgi:CarD family transcriptional regulator|nr:hypothetical protein D7X25_19490 [bacterium 1XD42-8]
MLKIGEYTMYSWYGACKVEDVREISKEDGKKMYYIFKPHNDKKATVMVPVDNERMREIISKEEAETLLKSIDELPLNWVENSRIRDELYMEILREGDTKRVLQLLKTLLLKKEEVKDAKGKMNMRDNRILTNTEKYLFSELSISLNVELEVIREQVSSNVISKYKEKSMY